MTVRRLTTIPLFTALMIVFTIVFYIPVPILNINVTLQTFVVILAGLLLRPIDAFISILLYVLIGALGFPVFTGYRGGLEAIFGPTGGFILSFPIAAYLISLFHFGKHTFSKNLIISTIFGIILIYFIAIMWLDYYTNRSLGKILYGMLIYIPFDIVKVVLASIISLRIESVQMSMTETSINRAI
ncbi:biotin transporter BioY [Mycoplasmatota bacterium]|nr:biotin transporter BioY [Mycoplasmatota bacterium]